MAAFGLPANGTAIGPACNRRYSPIPPQIPRRHIFQRCSFSLSARPNPQPYPQPELSRTVGNHTVVWNGEIWPAVGGIGLCLAEDKPIIRHFRTEFKDIQIPLNSIKSIQYRFGRFIGIIEVHQEGGLFMFRCYGANKLAAQLNEHQSTL